ncbi:MAG: hypothetical protein QOH20_2160 [Mycobacterium sp.]|nr:hypothetical protein [Mycobacterium sp.]
MARWRNGTRPWREVPRPRQAQRDRPGYWTICRVTACEPGREFGFEVLLGERPVNNWHYRFASVDGGTDVIESFRMTEGLFTTLFGLFGGQLRQRRNVRDMRKTLERIKAVVEA